MQADYYAEVEDGGARHLATAARINRNANTTQLHAD